STVVTQIGIETLPGSTLELFHDKDKRGSFTLSSDSPEPNRAKGQSSTQLVIFADRIQAKWKGGSTNAVKFALGYKIGSISGRCSDAGPMPADAEQLSDLLTVPIKSGEYKYGQPTKLVTFKGVTYSLVVNGPK